MHIVVFLEIYALFVEKTLKEKKKEKVNQAIHGELEGNNRLIFKLYCMARKGDKKYKFRDLSLIITMIIL